MNVQRFIDEYPVLYHMAEDGSWATIAKIGLLSTTALMDHCKTDMEIRQRIEACWRSNLEIIQCGELGEIKIRDQIPMSPHELEKCLIKPMKPSDWYKLINKKVFFWAQMEDLERLISAKYYKNKPHIVIKIKTSALVDKYFEQLKLSKINSGSAYYDFRRFDRAPLRDENTFQPIGNYNESWVKEVTVDYGIPDIREFTMSVERWIAERRNYEPASFKVIEQIWPVNVK